MSSHIQALLKALGYEKSNAEFLDQLIQKHGFSSSNTLSSSNTPPLIVFDCDQTLIQGDVGEILLSFLWKNRLVQSIAPFEALLIKDAFGEETGNLMLETMSVALRDSQKYFAYLWDLYKLLYETKVSCALTFAAGCLEHFEAHQRQSVCQQIFEQALTWDLAFEDLKADYLGIANPQLLLSLTPQDLETRYDDLFDCPKSIWVHVQPFLAQMSLMQVFQEHQFEVAVISGSAQLIVEEVARLFKLPLKQVVALHFENGVLLEPAPIHHRKIEACLHHFGRLPLMMFGDSLNDVPLMEKSTYALLVDYQKNQVVEKARHMGAMIQDFRLLSDRFSNKYFIKN
jgi:phosphoserine phosphatase